MKNAMLLALSVCGILMLSACGGGHVPPVCESNCSPPTHEFLYAGSAGTIETLEVDTATGTLGTAVSTPGPQTPGVMIVDPAKKFLYWLL